MLNIEYKEILNHPRAKIINKINHHLGSINGIVADIAVAVAILVFYYQKILKKFKKLMQLKRLTSLSIR